MPDLYDMRNNIDKAFEIAVDTQKKLGEPAPDEVSFVMGFITCFGIVTGRIDIGYDSDAPLSRVLENIHRDIMDFGRRIADNQAIQNGLRDKINGFKN